jgi:ABC-type Fe3+-hydroxamate transport system substrate-binding protein
MPLFTDQLGRTMTLDHAPARIVSLVPSQTELLYALDAPVAGITKFCVHPDRWFREMPRVGGTKNVDVDKVAALQPDLIIANKEENDRRQIERLAEHYPVWVSDVHDLVSALVMIREIGILAARAGQASAIADRIQRGFEGLSTAARPLRTAYLIWRSGNPPTYMAAGGDTFIHDMLRQCGLVNAFADRPRYPGVGRDDLAACDLILLSSEPYPFREKDADQLRSLVPNAVIMLVDGEKFSWYGSRLLEAPKYFSELLAALDR